MNQWVINLILDFTHGRLARSGRKYDISGSTSLYP